MEMVFFKKEPTFLSMNLKYPHFLFYLGTAMVGYFATQTIYYEILYHPDNLYLPLFVTDLKSENISHWFFPPSTYAFPDMFLMYLLSFCVSLKYLPATYGILNLTLILLSSYFFLKQELGKHKARLAIHLILLLLLVSISVSYFHESSLNLFVYLFTSGHHTSAIYLFLGTLSFYRFKSSRMSYFALCLPILFFGYLSDRFLLLCFISLIFIHKNRKEMYRWIILSFLILLFSEVLLQYLNYFYHIPSSFLNLLKNISNTSLGEFFLNTLTYFYIFFKLYFTRVGLLFHLIGICIILASILKKRKMRLTNSFLVFGILSFCFLGIIGRYAFPHAFPIRYLVPSLYCFLIYGLIVILKPASLSCTNYQMYYAFSYLLLAFSLFITLSITQTMVERIVTYREGILAYHQSQPNKRFWTSYIAEKKLRFWSENQLQPLPCDSEGNPYLWISGAFKNQFEVRAHCPQRGERIWVPNSLTKDF